MFANSLMDVSIKLVLTKLVSLGVVYVNAARHTTTRDRAIEAGEMRMTTDCISHKERLLDLDLLFAGSYPYPYNTAQSSVGIGLEGSARAA